MIFEMFVHRKRVAALEIRVEDLEGRVSQLLRLLAEELARAGIKLPVEAEPERPRLRSVQ